MSRTFLKPACSVFKRREVLTMFLRFSDSAQARSRVTHVLTAVLLACAGESVAAVIDCTSTPFVVNAGTGDRTLTSADVIRTTSNTLAVCVELRDGRDLNLNGARIECANPSGRCQTAVKAYSSSSILQGGTISGSFEIGAVDVEEVKNLAIDGVNQAVITGGLGKRVFGNVITNAWIGIGWTSSTGNTSYIRNNFIDSGVTDWQSGNPPSGLDGCGSSTSPGLEIDHNLVRNTTDGISVTGCSGTRYIRVTENILVNMTGAEITTTGTSASVTGNVCSDATSCPVAPGFVMP
jgi:hypothetical protein